RIARCRNRRPRAGRASRSVLGGGGGDPRRARRRDHRVDLRPRAVRLAPPRSGRTAAQRDTAPRRARSRRARWSDGLVAAHAEAAHHGPPPAHHSSRVNASVLGMFLFIASEVMLFGSFFTAYFFVR